MRRIWPLDPMLCADSPALVSATDLTFADKVSDVALVATFHDQGGDVDDPQVTAVSGNPYSMTMMCAILCHPYMATTKVAIIIISRKIDN
jgi:hypothetical protein